MDDFESIKQEHTLYKMMAEERSIKRIVRRASEFLGNPVIVPDTLGGVIAKSTDDYVHDEIWNNFSDNDATEQLLTFDARHRRALRNIQAGEAVVLELEGYEHRWLYTNVWCNEYRVAVICVPEIERPFAEGDERLILCLASIVAFRYLHDSMYTRERNIDRRKVLIKLVDGEYVPPEMMEEVFAEIDFGKPTSSFTCVVQSDSFVAGKVDLLTHQHWFEQRIAGSIGYVRDDRIYLLVMRNVDEASVEIAASISKRVADYVENQHLLMGVSRRFRSVEHYGRHLNEAMFAVECCRLEGSGCVAEFDGVWSQMVYERVIASSSPEELMCGKALAVVHYDSTCGTHYLEDLTAYLCCGRSLYKTAEMLSIHRNTVKYRVGKLVEIFGIDFDDENELFALTLSVRMYDYARRRKMAGLSVGDMGSPAL